MLPATVSPSFALRGICVLVRAAPGSLNDCCGNLVGGSPAFVPTADLFAQGAAVPTPELGIAVGFVAQGAAVPTPGPGIVVGLLAHGAAVPIPGSGIIIGLLAHGAFFPSCGGGGARAEAFSSDGLGPSLTGWFDVCTEDGGGAALGSCSQLKREPKRKCWTTGNLERTSALYILTIP